MITANLFTRSSQLALPALNQTVTVYRCKRGIPHIEAANERDLYIAQGYCTAQDRLWQIDIMRRLASGRLAEIFGKPAIDNDKFYRAMQLTTSASLSLANYDAHTRQMLEHFCMGINAYIDFAINNKQLPLEFKILKYEMDNWRSQDSLLIGKLLAFKLSLNFRHELFRYEVFKKVDKELLQALLPHYPEEGHLTIKGQNQPVHGEINIPPSSQLELQAVLEMFEDNSMAGSNGWVIAGDKTKSGKPILANDPHVSISVPGYWYQTHLILKDQLNVIGVTVPGLPGVMAGHNESIAWGITCSEADTQDLYIEQRSPNNYDEFLYQGDYERAEVKNETIKVKNGEAISLPVVITRHGPIISDLLESNCNKDQALALRWVGHEATTELTAIYQINRAATWQEFKKALTFFQTPSLNFIFADSANIAFRTSGLIPIRNHNCELPICGASEKFEWQGYIPFDAMPELINPECGYIVTANNKIIGNDYPYRITNDWNIHYRANRIASYLDQSSSFTVSDMMALQLDVLNLQAAFILPIVLPYIADLGLKKLAEQAYKLLLTWDYQDDASQAAPYIYHKLCEQLAKNLFVPIISESLYQQMPDRWQQLDAALRCVRDAKPHPWLEKVDSVSAWISKSFEEALACCSKEQGRNIKKWQWGRFHELKGSHIIGEKNAFLGLLFNTKKTAISGSHATVMLMTSNKETGVVFEAAPWRQVVDLNDLAANSWDIVYPGNSGNSLKKCYRNQAKQYQKGYYQLQLFNEQYYRKYKSIRFTSQSS